jgi:hypothetical protein
MVLPKLNSFTGSPTTIATIPASTAPIPAINKTIIINLNPSAAPRANRHATIPSYCVHRQPTIPTPVPKKEYNPQLISSLAAHHLAKI